LAFEALGSDDDVEDPRLVFQREKDEALGRPGALAADDEPRVGDALAVAPVLLQLASGADAVGAQEFAQVAHGVADEGRAGGAVVGVGGLEARHGGEGRGLGAWARRGEGTGVTANR